MTPFLYYTNSRTLHARHGAKTMITRCDTTCSPSYTLRARNDDDTCIVCMTTRPDHQELHTFLADHVAKTTTIRVTTRREHTLWVLHRAKKIFMSPRVAVANSFTLRARLHSSSSSIKGTAAGCFSARVHGFPDLGPSVSGSIPKLCHRVNASVVRYLFSGSRARPVQCKPQSVCGHIGALGQLCRGVLSVRRECLSSTQKTANMWSEGQPCWTPAFINNIWPRTP